MVDPHEGIVMHQESDQDDMSPEQEAEQERQSVDAFDRMVKHLADENDRREMYRERTRGK